MPKITRLQNDSEKQRIRVYIDGSYCCSIRERTWQAMGLQEGSQISCEELKKEENFFWKKAYGKIAWEKEKQRLMRVKQWVECYLPAALKIEVIGFGADSNEAIWQHPEEKGKPDLSIFLPMENHNIEVIALEVTGTEFKRGEGYWVRPDKLLYVQQHPEQDIWIALHYRYPQECFIWIKPQMQKVYTPVFVEIRGANECYVVFHDHDDEVKSSTEFKAHVLLKLKKFELK